MITMINAVLHFIARHWLSVSLICGVAAAVAYVYIRRDILQIRKPE